ncbi:permease for cytosine/purines, uracil, thiamine, allantoin-domain-containing protein [Amylocystis lapponica]|nr:permease for cytosine/purines, uracil, thiamine, allantoin-domain-containing protein [Amylocystis lapponica]
MAEKSSEELASATVVETPSKRGRLFRRLATLLSQWGVETNGIAPISPEQRTDPRLYQMFLIWFSGNVNILTLTSGTVGPAFYGLGIRDSLLVILVVDIFTWAIPAYFSVFGPKLGTRAMVQARFTWGYYGAIVPSVLNVLSLQGYLILDCIVGGQTLGSVSPHLNASLGIVIIGLTSLVVTFCGCQFLHWYETVVWVPNVVAFVVMLGVGGKHLVDTPLYGPTPASVSAIMTFGATLAATNVSWATLTPDYGVYHSKDASTLRIFVYSYLGFIVSSVPAHMLGASFTAAASYVPAWGAGLGNGNDIGGLIAAVLGPAGWFGKLLLVLLALTAPSQCAPTMYTACTSLMTVAPALARVPRSVMAVISTAILIPVGIVGSTTFYSTFVDILSLIGYWLGPHCAITLVEHLVFRKHRWSSYTVMEAWDCPRHPNLPRGYAALGTFVVCVGLIVLCMQQEWWTGPIARRGTGDLGMLIGFISGLGIYLAARAAERWWQIRRRGTQEYVS